MQSLPASGDEVKVLNPREAVNKIREAKIINPSCSINVTTTGKEEATVVIERDLQASDEDCKIDAILVTRTLMDGFPNQLVRVKSVFAQGAGDSSQATVTAGDIKAFKSGQLDKEALLDSIELVRVSTLEPFTAISEVGGSTRVVPGPFQPWRLIILEHINKLASVGVNVKVFLDDFNQIEKMIGVTDEKQIKRRLLRLNYELAEQDQLTREAKQPIFRGPIKATSKRPMAQLNQRLQELAGQGKDVSAYRDKLKEIRRLRMSGQEQEAITLMNELSRSLGI